MSNDSKCTVFAFSLTSVAILLVNLKAFVGGHTKIFCSQTAGVP